VVGRVDFQQQVAHSVAFENPPAAPAIDMEGRSDVGGAGDGLPRVVRVEGERVFLDAGEDAGWAVGDLIRLRTEEQIADLEGRPLGEFAEEVGTIRLVKVFPLFSVGEVESLEEGQSLAIGQLGERVRTSPTGQ